MLLVLLSVATHAAEKRQFLPDDVLSLNKLGEASLSPDGLSVVFVLMRPISEGARFDLGNLQGLDRADIWLCPASGGVPENLTNGAKDGTGFWAPKWSPDGQRLSMLSTRGGRIHAWVWTRATHTLQMISRRGVGFTDWSDAVQWLSDSDLVFVAATEVEKPLEWTLN